VDLIVLPGFIVGTEILPPTIYPYQTLLALSHSLNSDTDHPLSSFDHIDETLKDIEACWLLKDITDAFPF
jgi:hypothetical protein